MSKILQASKHIEIEMACDNIFLLDFTSQLDRRRALFEGPWNFFKDLIIFKEPTGLQNPSEIHFVEYAIWVQLHKLPLAFMHPTILRNLGGHIGKVCEVDTDKSGHCYGKFARVRVIRRLDQPLRRDFR